MITDLTGLDSIRGRILRVEQLMGDTSLLMLVQLCRQDRLSATPQTWRIRAACVQTFRILDEEFELIQRVDRHPILMAYHHDELELYFQGATADVFETIGRLYAEHASKVHGWIPFSAYLNGGLPLPKLLAAQAGMLARGPRPLIEAYKAVLESSGRRCNVLPGEPAVGNSVEGPYGLLLGSTYVVASAFEAKILGESAALLTRETDAMTAEDISARVRGSCAHT